MKLENEIKSKDNLIATKSKHLKDLQKNQQKAKKTDKKQGFEMDVLSNQVNRLQDELDSERLNSKQMASQLTK